jgi:uncharacterized protein (TIRG00374 family)
MKSDRLVRWIKVIGVLLFLYILSTLNLSLILDQLFSFRLEWLAVYCMSFIGMVLLKALRWRSALNAQGIRLPLGKTLTVTANALFLAAVTPARIGEFSKVAYLQQERLTLSESLASVFLDRAYDVVFLFLFAGIGFLYMGELFASSVQHIVVIVLSTAIIALFLYLVRRGFWRLIQGTMRVLLPHALLEKTLQHSERLLAELKRIAIPSAFAMASFSLVIYGLYFTQIYCVARGFGVSISFVFLGLCLSLSALISLLPVSIGGLGTREAVFVVLLSKVSIPSELAVLISFMDGVVLSLLLNGLGVVLLWIFFRGGRASNAS